MANLTYDFSVGSLNVRGLNGQVKRHAIFDWARKKDFDIIMLQECYCDAETNANWATEWGGECLFSNGTKHSCGTMVLFNKSFEFKIEDSKIDSQGRFIFVKLEIDGEKFILLNIYGPTKQSEKQSFFSKIANNFVELDISINDKLVLGGDFNVIFDSSIDKKGGREKIEAVPRSLSQIIETYDMVDLWRIQHPALKRFSFRKKTPLIQSRLDFFLVSSSIQDIVDKTDIIPSVWSDHSAITIHITNIPDKKRGRGLWKYNASLNMDEAYVTLMNNNIDKWLRDYRNVADKRMQWEIIKFEIRNFTMSYTSEKQKTKNSKYNQMNLDLERLGKLSVDIQEQI